MVVDLNKEDLVKLLIRAFEEGAVSYSEMKEEVAEKLATEFIEAKVLKLPAYPPPNYPVTWFMPPPGIFDVGDQTTPLPMINQTEMDNHNPSVIPMHNYPTNNYNRPSVINGIPTEIRVLQPVFPRVDDLLPAELRQAIGTTEFQRAMQSGIVSMSSSSPNSNGEYGDYLNNVTIVGFDDEGYAIEVLEPTPEPGNHGF